MPSPALIGLFFRTLIHTCSHEACAEDTSFETLFFQTLFDDALTLTTGRGGRAQATDNGPSRRYPQVLVDRRSCRPNSGGLGRGKRGGVGHSGSRAGLVREGLGESKADIAQSGIVAGRPEC